MSPSYVVLATKSKYSFGEQPDHTLIRHDSRESAIQAAIRLRRDPLCTGSLVQIISIHDGKVFNVLWDRETVLIVQDASNPC